MTDNERDAPTGGASEDEMAARYSGMKRTVALTVGLAAITVPAYAEAPQYVPVHHADRMTVRIAEADTYEAGFKLRSNEAKWPDGARVTVYDCKVVHRRKGTCRMDIDRAPKVCRYKSSVLIRKRSHNIVTRLKTLSCGTTP